MRAAFSIFHGAMPENYRPRLAVELQTFAQKLGAARDWDVLVEETIASMPIRLQKQRSTELLVRIARARRAEGHESAHASLRDPRYTKILLQLASWVDSQFGSNGSLPQQAKWKLDVLARPAPAFAAEVMQTFHDKALKLGGKVRKLDPPEIHRLRIRIKKLRYATDFFGGLWPNRRTDRYLAALKGLQQDLGEFHDLTVAGANRPFHRDRRRRCQAFDRPSQSLADQVSAGSPQKGHRVMAQVCQPETVLGRCLIG
jgi:CHAD domain-containing protein